MRLIDADQFGVISLQGKSKDFIDGTLFILDKIYEAPTIEERPRGEWVKKGGLFYTYECSACGGTTLKEWRTDFCPNCGAKMEVQDDT